MRLDSEQVVIRPLITEKGVTAATHENTYAFEVNLYANKADVRRAIEDVFDVHVLSVHTMIRKGKRRRVRYVRGRTRNWKKAVIKLAPGDTIGFI